MKEKVALIIGGSNGIGLSIATQLKKNYDKIYIVDKSLPSCNLGSNVEYIKFNLLNDDYSIFNNFKDINTLVITSGFGRVSAFEDLNESEIINNFKVNTIGIIRIVKIFYDKLCNDKDFNCAIMGSIAGLVSSPLFSVYGSTKAALCKFIESINIELEMKGSKNRILNVSPGSIKGTNFNGGTNDINETYNLANDIIEKMNKKETIFIPEYAPIYKDVLDRYNNDPHEFGINSYNYKIKNNRINEKPQLKIGYLSGTFDLFHIGHLNLLKKAKEYCDYLVVGVHKDASHKNKEVYIPYNERVEILKQIKYVDEVIQSLPEDNEVYNVINYDFLFVGSDYKDSERFNRYEEYFSDKGVKIIYFPYTKGTSSTKLRTMIDKKISLDDISTDNITIRKKVINIDNRELNLR